MATATIGIVSVGITGRVHTSCELARRLAARGHRVVLASTEPRARERFGDDPELSFHALDDGVPLELRDRLEQAPAGSDERWRLRATATRLRGESALRGHGIDAFLDAVQPDLLLVESELHHTILYLQRTDVPVALLEYHLSIRRRRGIPPLDSELLPTDPFASVRATLAWRRTLLRRRLQRLRDRRRLAPWDPRSVHERLAQAAGTTLRAIARDDQWPLLYYPELPSLRLCLPDLDFPHTRPDVGRFVGPIVQAAEHRARRAEHEPCLQWLHDRTTTRPLVLCATGSILTLPGFTKKMLAAADGADFDLLVATGRHGTPADFDRVHDNVRAFRLVPQLDALAHAALFVCHGGITSVHESLAAGTPMLVCSGGAMDENGNAARVAFHGLGRRGDRRRDDARSLRRTIDELLADPTASARVRACRDRLAQHRDDALLEGAVDDRLERTSTGG